MEHTKHENKEQDQGHHEEHSSCCSDEKEDTEKKEQDHGEHGGHEGHGSKKEGHDCHDGDHTEHHAMMAEDFKRRFFIALVISIPVLILSPTIQGWFNFSIAQFTGDKFVLFGLASIIALYTAWPFYTNGYEELKEKQLGMMVLVSLAVLTGYLYSVAATFFIDAKDFYWEISTLTLVLLLGHWIEMRAVVGTSGALKELVKLIPPKANLIKNDGSTEIVETAELKVNDMILIKPGEKVPIDGIIVEGESSINESLITGESKPVAKKVADEVIGGSLNVDGALTVKVAKIGEDTALSQIVELVKTAQSSKPKSQKLADRAAHWLTIIAITVGLLTFFAWNFWFGATFVFALTLAITVVVITCPHALGLAIPAVTTITTTLAAKNGILVKNMDGLE
jgi:P-type Cu2+ transporter